ncbi:MAG: stage V sporulation protein AC [Ruminococcaceae bacterium]|nr:stage V sporulation protein AC [Oscillospiraceae bacterium]
MKKITTAQYKEMLDNITPGSSFLLKSLRAFLIGGAICMIAQFICNYLIGLNLSQNDASTFTSIIMILISAVLTGLNVYGKIAKFAGAGTLVPITGFANAVVSPAMEFKTEGYILGLGAKMFIIAGPVIVYGVLTSVICGFLLLIFRTVIG